MNGASVRPLVGSRTIGEVLIARGECDPNREAYRFLRYRSAGQPLEEQLTYGGMLERARAVAAMLQQRCVQGDRALILAPPGLDYIAGFFGCVLAGVIAVPAYPPRNPKHIGRLASIAEDCGAAVVLTVADLLDRLAEWGEKRLPDAIPLDRLPADAASAWRQVDLRRDDLAFLQYTSGTTGAPKGVMVSHDNLIVNWRAFEQFKFEPEDILVAWLPPYHDLGLIGCILQPMFSGFLQVSMAPAAFMQDPVRWIRALSDYRAAVTMAPNFAFEIASQIGENDGAEQFDLSALRHTIAGGEPPRAATLGRFARRFAANGFRPEAFRPGYGLAETTLHVTVSIAERVPRVVTVRSSSTGPNRGLLDARFENGLPAEGAVSNGPVIEGHDLRIVNPETCRECKRDHAV
jgi:acyl-CoA synthetase (AMP-forming)/AMP-acid ligase II